ncbi:MAG TPA: phosphatidate cytidylyltransferase [Phototrophicaceae bacterium]|nr:phosphatidate cytidylyltransferase [Phototrophicaceae bacterium]
MTQTSEPYASSSSQPPATPVSASEAVTDKAIPIPTNTITRMLSAFVILPIVIYAWVTGGIAFTALILAAFVIATLEMVTILREGQVGLTTLAAIGLTVALILAIINGQPVYGAAAFIIGGLTIAGLELAVGRRDPGQLIILIALNGALALIGGMCILLRNQIPGVFWWLLIFVGTWGTDTLAFAGGHAYGKTPLLTAWSPKKTIEGTLTGVIGAMVIGVFVLAYFKLISPLTLLIIALTPFAAVIGDLIESRFKRVYHVKDSSVKGFNVMPGHGGMLDRIDSMMAVVTIVFMILWLAV